MKYPAISAALLAFLIAVAAVIAGDQSARALESRYVHALAPRHAPINITGSALQKIAFEQGDLLPIYGASEVLSQPSEFQPAQFFAPYPTGFTTFEVAKGGVGSLIVAESLAAVGSDLRGKQVVISYTPGPFTSKMYGADAYAGLFSRLHAIELAFSTDLGFETKQMAAKRMLQYPKTLEKDPLLKFTLEHLADGSWSSRALYDLALPLGKLQVLVLELQDEYNTVTYIQAQKNLSPDVPHQPAHINWNFELVQARREQIPHSNDNPFGFDNQVWTQKIRSTFKVRPNASGNKSYLTNLQASAEWTDFEIVLRILKEEGAQPLILGRPMNAAYYDAIGISATARQTFYDKMR